MLGANSTNPPKGGTHPAVDDSYIPGIA